MSDPLPNREIPELGSEESADAIRFSFAMGRRCFVQVLGTGLMIAVHPAALAQNRGGRSGGRGSGGAKSVGARVHLAKDGTFTILTGKIEMGQGARTEITQAAAEELRVSPSRIQLIMGDTSQVPDDGLSAGSRTTPATLPSVRQGAAAARQLLVGVAAKQWQVDPVSLEARDGNVIHKDTKRSISYGDLAASPDLAEALKQSIPNDVALAPVAQWKVMGNPLPRVNARALVTGEHRYPSDMTLPGMLYGKVLRPPTYDAKLLSVDLAPVRALKNVVAVWDGGFAGVAAETTFAAEHALKVLAGTAKWETVPQPSSREIFDYLRNSVAGGLPANPYADEAAQAPKRLTADFQAAYVQHAPMETRCALAEWRLDKLTVFTGTQNPFGYHNELVRTFRLANEDVRVVVPDFGNGFGGKHTAEAAIEAARLAKAAEKPVLIRWSREEEFTWAYFRPAALITIEASLDSNGKIGTWHFVNVNSGGAAIDSPYQISKAKSRAVGAKAPLRQGSYRALASTANNFARECFMDELAFAAGADPLKFRLDHLETGRLRAVLEEAARRFDWPSRVKSRQPGTGVGLACGTEKGSYVAACVEAAVDQAAGKISVRHVTQVFECGAIVNPDNLLAQVQGCIIMGLGPALREEMRFADGKMGNAAFSRYLVPRFADVPELDIHLLNRPDLPSVGGGETPIIAIAPAIANAVFHATGKRVRQMPIRPVS